MCSTTSPRNPRRITSPRSTFRLLCEDSKWRRSPGTNRFAVEVRSSRCCTRRTGRVSLDRPGSEKWTTSSFATKYCATWWALRVSTVKPTAGTAGCELVLHNGNFPGYGCVPRAEWLRRYSANVLPNGDRFWYKEDDSLWWLGKISASTTADGVHLVRFLDDPGPIKLPLTPACYTNSTGAVRGSWCVQIHLAGAFARWVQRSVDKSRGEAVD